MPFIHLQDHTLDLMNCPHESALNKVYFAFSFGGSADYRRKKMEGEGGKNSVEGNQEPLGVIQIAPLYLLFFWES